MEQDPHILVFPSDGTGCGVYRMAWPGNVVATAGKPVNVLPRPPQIAIDNQGQVRGALNLGTAKAIVLQRPGSYQVSQLIPILQEKGVKVIIDMDDSLSTIHPRNAAFKFYDPRFNHKTNWMHAAKACELADWVTVTTESLAEEYGKHGRVSVIPNHIPESYLKIQRPLNEVPVVGWAGWTNTHIDDLRVTSGMINQLLVETGAKFAALGDENIFRDLGIRRQPPHEHWGFTSIPDYPDRLVGMDIGLVPLQKSKFNECKSWLKGLEYASLGIVPVVSPTPDNMKLVELGGAIVAEKPKDWYDRVKELIVDNEYRQEMSKQVREVASNLTIEGNWEKWWDVWSSVV